MNLLPRGSRSKFSLSIAGMGVSLWSPDTQWDGYFKRTYAAFQTTNPVGLAVWLDIGEVNQLARRPLVKVHEHWVEISGPGWSGKVDYQLKEGFFQIDRKDPLKTIDLLLRVIYSLLAYRKGGLLFHGAGILHNQRVSLFLGPSGSGKTTIARLSPMDQVFNDDLVICMPVADKWYVYSTPFWNEEQVLPTMGEGLLNFIFRLVKDTRPWLEPMPSGLALAGLIAALPVLTRVPAFAQNLIQRCQAIVESVPVYQLHFRRDETFWKLIDQL